MKWSCCILAISISSVSAAAYIDPGTGGMITGSLWPVIVGIVTAVGGFCARYFYRPVKKRVISLWQKIR
ncbi:hypothetical protein COV20_01970 [Candidatus Woesearchaeota archaeon CG10_big_fil_rev_8_21_14_0_10_45_16]|nr:MAG: hypothetical protein COV20_01970 [Candidatus Woesearchaeota archaeon CG10_big_fil_rev_8_21_14_0_10_45_16]